MSLPVSEAQLQRTLIEAAQWYGFRVCHFRPARTLTGWRTPVEGDAGFPDVVAALDGHVYAWELKAAGGRLTRDQTEWGRALGGGNDTPLRWGVVRPTTLDETLRELRLISEGRRP